MLYRAWFAERGLFDDKGEALPGLERWARFEAAARVSADALGLTPISMAKLLSSLATTAVAVGDDDALAALRAEGQRILEARQIASIPEPDKDSAA